MCFVEFAEVLSGFVGGFLWPAAVPSVPAEADFVEPDPVFEQFSVGFAAVGFES